MATRPQWLNSSCFFFLFLFFLKRENPEVDGVKHADAKYIHMPQEPSALAVLAKIFPAMAILMFVARETVMLPTQVTTEAMTNGPLRPQ